MMCATQEADLSGYRAHSAQGTQYGGPYAGVYGPTALSSAYQVGVGGKEAASSGLQGRYPSALQDLSKLSSAAVGSNFGMNTDD
ncbi:uncharacterized protein A4U43_C07F13270 [Asparagus officinalis]|uniref:Uncharacterized protein n=1 Tax=Asparagus officinalis TaxID=4686 RepID=A0A5P1EBT1_ASPOF|nr:uncharacterized protein A4U43_C07F13270 [Asparagus officinalis]